MRPVDVMIIGAGASGLMCAARAGLRGRSVLVADHQASAGRKILVSGGGRCNFTNRTVGPDHYISGNPHFCKSALSRFSPQDFLDLAEAHGIEWEERDLGQLFCTGSASQILDMLMSHCRQAGVTFFLGTPVTGIEPVEPAADHGPRFRIIAGAETVAARSLVIATGGVSIPGAGATPFGYRVAEQFGLRVVPPRPGLVPFTLHPADKRMLQPLSGISVEAGVVCRRAGFTGRMLFTHRGLSGPVILQVSSYWQPGEEITIDLLPRDRLMDVFAAKQAAAPRKQLRSILCEKLPKRLVDVRLAGVDASRPLGAMSKETLRQAAAAFHQWRVRPGGTEGYRTAEVTVGGVDCCGISSRTMEAVTVPGLFFIGEVLDVTGWLGGYNLHWAWASGYCAGQAV